jgi:hypothetical protein
MKSTWPEEPWEAHSFALGMSAAGQPLEERLTMLGRRNGWSRRKLLGAGLLLAAAAPLALVPWQVSAQEHGGDGAPLAEQWEDVLLLDALRYLRLAPWQLQEFRSIARVTDDRLRKLQDQEAKTQASLRRITRKQREALVAGKAVSLQEQTNALLLEKTLKTGRAKAAEEILAYALPRAARVLSPEQKVRALLLTYGETPANTAKRPALLDPPSGFVMTEAIREQVGTAAARTILARRYPAEVLDALGSSFRDYIVLSDSLTIKRTDFEIGAIRVSPPHKAGPTQLFFQSAPSEPPLNVPKAQFEAAQRESERLRKWPALADELVRNAAPKEVEEALGFHVRRLFTSPRLRTVIEERLRGGGQTVEEDPEPTSEP